MHRPEIDIEEVQILPWPTASVLLWLFAAPILWMHHQESKAFALEFATIERSNEVKRAYRDRVFRETPPPPPKGGRVRVNVGGVIVAGDQVQ